MNSKNLQFRSSLGSARPLNSLRAHSNLGITRSRRSTSRRAATPPIPRPRRRPWIAGGDVGEVDGEVESQTECCRGRAEGGGSGGRSFAKLPCRFGAPCVFKYAHLLPAGCQMIFIQRPPALSVLVLFTCYSLLTHLPGCTRHTDLFLQQPARREPPPHPATSYPPPRVQSSLDLLQHPGLKFIVYIHHVERAPVPAFQQPRLLLSPGGPPLVSLGSGHPGVPVPFLSLT
ncbi:hypothetical protein C2E23DRAFT_62385 [Lenzites betulinus]|nr:hypothetical protein C2E23DRAFT_62385 [Lenzites betulinus]